MPRKHAPEGEGEMKVNKREMAESNPGRKPQNSLRRSNGRARSGGDGGGGGGGGG
eukprot:CAMPEP_0119352936 /NCGR_PEP_ID=MMETSP1334-20130426/2151_1 /TAXON_ID=127549 /ORGANISM="Calcidiscus leptoporus, Strain RCC1130" /LENGTH=54 /DNA_ID=CAMNT_0007366089 /DNA_START=72 /DNA_END=233 /DNA_ORIENTATION=+